MLKKINDGDGEEYDDDDDDENEIIDICFYSDEKVYIINIYSLAS